MVSDTGDGWFVVVPDAPSGAAAVARLRQRARCVVEHASGRPFLLGDWAEEEVTVASAGRLRAVLAGPGPGSDAALRRALEGLDDLAALDRLLAELPGSFHLAASLGGRVRVQGTVSSVRRVFFSQVGGTVLAADRGDVLARMIDAGWDERMLALRLLAQPPPVPLAGRSPWRGVHAVPDGSWLRMDPDGTACTVPWWRPPEPVVSLREGAAKVRTRLAEAVAVRTGGGGVVGADLSGGMDSASLCFLAAGGRARLVTYRQGSGDAGNDDERFAAFAAAELPGAEHLADAPDRLPPMFMLPPDAAEGDEPCLWVRSRARLMHTARRLAEAGAGVHLSGYGGDELFLPAPSYLHTLVRTRPRAAWAELRARRALNRWPALATLRALSCSASYPRWLAGSARRLERPMPAPSAPHMQWGLPPRLPPWASPEAVRAVRELLVQAAEADAEPLHRLRVQHDALHHVRVCGRAARQANQLMSARGVRSDVPFLDQRVIEAALAIRPDQRGSASVYKPALAAAMRGLVPRPLLERTTKGDYADDAWAGLRAQRAALLALFDSSRLAELGLIDIETLRAALRAPHATTRTLIPVEATLACESWLQKTPHPVERS